MILCREEFINTFRELKDRREVLTGSTSEGVRHPPSDDDTMFVYTSPEIQVQSSMEEAIQHNAPLMIPSDTSPGYCLLWVPDVSRHQAAHLCVLGYLSSLLWKERFIQAGGYIHGPCISGFCGPMEFDNAHGLHARRWPSIATEWAHRERRYGWPTPSVVKKIIDNGCHVVAKGDPDSPNEDCLWLVSFALAERTLVHTFNHTQFLIYNFVKLILKRIIDVCEPDIITSYFIKTIMFYCIENTDNAMWDSELLDACYCKCITTLYHFVEEMYCPNYFVKENNMFKRKINSVNQPRVLSLLQWLLHLGIEGVLYHIEERWVLGMQITPTLTELRSDAEFLHGGTYRWLALDIVKITQSTSVTADTCKSFLQMFQKLVLDNASLHMTQEHTGIHSQFCHV